MKPLPTVEQRREMEEVARLLGLEIMAAMKKLLLQGNRTRIIGVEEADDANNK